MSAPLAWARPLFVGGVVLGGVLAGPHAAHAARVAILQPRVDADSKISEGKRQKFHETLTAGLQEAASADTVVVPASEVRETLHGSRELLECQEGACLNKAAAQLKADRLIVPQINIKGSVGGSAYKIALSVYDATGAPLPILGTEACGDESDGCTLPRAYEAMKRAAAAVAAQVAVPTVPEKLAPPPPAPQPVPVPAPDLGLKDPSALPLGDAAPQAASPPAPYNKGYRIGWIVAAAAGGAFIVSSIPFLYYASKENEITCGTGPRTQCPTVYTGNLGPGLGLLLGGGLASAGAFAVLFYLDKREQKRAAGQVAFHQKPLVAPVLAPMAGGGLLGAVGRF